MKAFLLYTLMAFILALVIDLIFAKNKTITQIINPYTELAGAILVGVFVLPIGFVYSIVMSIKKLSLKGFLNVFVNLALQFSKVVSWIVLQLAVGIDMIGNVISGEMLENAITTETNTTFGDGNITISASTGKLQAENKIDKKFGIFFNKALSKIFGVNHSIDAWKNWLIDQTKNWN